MTKVHDEGRPPGAPSPTRTSPAFGAVEVGPPVSRLTPRDDAASAAPPAAAPAGGDPGRCAACGSRVRAGQPWCLLCHADLRTPVPAPAPVPVRSAATSRPDPEPVLVEEPVLDQEPVLDEEEVERMLRHLAATGTSRVRGLDSRQARIAVAVGGGVGLAALLLGGTAVLGGITG